MRKHEKGFYTERYCVVIRKEGKKDIEYVSDDYDESKLFFDQIITEKIRTTNSVIFVDTYKKTNNVLMSKGTSYSKNKSKKVV